MSVAPLLEHYGQQKADLESQKDAITALAFARSDHALSEQDRENLAILDGKLAEVITNIEAVATQQVISDRARQALAAGQVGTSYAEHEYRTEGEAVADMLNADRDSGAKFRYERALDRAAQHMGSIAENTTPIAGGFDGLVVPTVQGPVINLYNWQMPFLSLIGPRNSGNAQMFLRPRIVDPDFYTAAAEQGLEKAELPSKKWDYVNDPVSLVTIGNYINLSYQAELFAPGALQSTIDQLRNRTSASLESRTVAEAAKTTANVNLPADADAAALQAAVWEALGRVFDATGAPATWLLAGSKGIAMLGSTVDLAGRPLFPIEGPSNALGTSNPAGYRVINPFGLQVVVSRNITDTTLYVGNDFGLEAYLYRFPILQAIEPSVLGRQIAAAAAVGFYRPPTTEAGAGGTPAAKFEGIVKISSGPDA